MQANQPYHTLKNNDKRIIAAITVYFQTLKNVQREW